MATPAQVRQRLPLSLNRMKNALVALIRKKDLVLHNGFVNVPANAYSSINLAEAVPNGEQGHYSLQLARVNIAVLDDDNASPTHQAYVSPEGKATYALMTGGTLRIYNTTGSQIRVAVFVSANRT